MTKRQVMLSVRVSEEEKKRVKKLAAELKRTHRYLKEADVIRELIGLEDTGVITPEIRKRLRPPAIDTVSPELPVPDTSPYNSSNSPQQYDSAASVPTRKKGALK